jgi:rhodanese-related sulfurtransferase
MQVPTVTVDALSDEAVLLDVREDHEWDAGHIDGAVHIPMMSVPQRLTYASGPIRPENDVVVVCHVGGRSAQVTAWLNANGYRAANLAGGMAAWQAAGRPMVSETGRPPTAG